MGDRARAAADNSGAQGCPGRHRLLPVPFLAQKKSNEASFCQPDVSGLTFALFLPRKKQKVPPATTGYYPVFHESDDVFVHVFAGA